MDAVPDWYPPLVQLLEDEEMPLDRERIKAGVREALVYVHTHRAEIQPLQLRLEGHEERINDLVTEAVQLRQANRELSELVKRLNATP